MSQVQNISKHDELNVQSSETNRFSTCEEIVEILVEQGLPETYSSANYINKIAKVYGINLQEARTCLKLAVKQLESKTSVEDDKDDELNAKCGYYYPSGYTSSKKDGMDSLSFLGSYNRLMFGIK